MKNRFEKWHVISFLNAKITYNHPSAIQNLIKIWLEYRNPNQSFSKHLQWTFHKSYCCPNCIFEIHQSLYVFLSFKGKISPNKSWALLFIVLNISMTRKRKFCLCIKVESSLFSSSWNKDCHWIWVPDTFHWNLFCYF